MLQMSWHLIKEAFPNIILHLLTYMMLTMGIYFISKSGDQTMIAGIGLAITWAYSTTLAPIDTLNTGTLVLCSASFGAEEYRLAGLSYHRGVILRLLGLLPSYCLILLSYAIFVSIGVDERVADAAYTFGAYLLPYLATMAFFNATKYYAISQKVIFPMLLIQGVVFIAHCAGCELFVIHLQLELQGIAYSLAISHFIGAVLLLIYLSRSTKFKETFFLPERESFKGLLTQLKKEAYIAAPTYLEWLGIELYTIGAAAFFNTNNLAAWVIFYGLLPNIYMIPFGLGIVASVEVGNAFGERNIRKARIAIRATVYLSIIGIGIEILVLWFLKTQIISLFDNLAEVVHIGVVVLELYLIALPADFLQVNIVAILKAVGKERLAGFFFFVCHYVLGMTVAYVLAVVYDLQAYGIMIGIGVGLYSLCILASVTLFFTKMPEQMEAIHERIVELNQNS